MASSSQSALTSTRRRNRRRRQDKPAISAKLVLDDHIKSDVGIVSEDIFRDLFPNLGNGKSSAPLNVNVH
jgi:peroxin-6